MYKSKLSADPTSLILGIIALVLGIAGCCCYGITAILPLGLAIGGLVMANRSIKEYRANPEAFDQSSYANVNTARIINIIAVILNAIVVLIFIIVLILYGTIFSAAFLESMRQGSIENNDYEYENYEWETDTDAPEAADDAYILEREIDSVTIDSTNNN